MWDNKTWYGYLSVPGYPGGLPQAADDLHEVVVGVGGQSVPPGVETEGRAPGYGEVECYVGGRLKISNRSQWADWIKVRNKLGVIKLERHIVITQLKHWDWIRIMAEEREGGEG